MTLIPNGGYPASYDLKDKTIHALISIQAENFPETIAIKHNNESITYRELESASNQIAAFFNSKITRGDVIAVAMDRSIQMSVCLLAIMKAGGTYLPIDPNLPLERVNFLIEDADVKLLVNSKKYNDLYTGHIHKIIFDDIWINRAGYPDDFLPVSINDDDLTYIIYTSGSTGYPKGVGITHKSLLNLLLCRLHTPGICQNDNMLGITTMSFDISEEELLLPLISGALLTIVDLDIARDGRALLEIIKREKITIMQGTPYIWQMMLEAGWNSSLPLKIFCGGEPMTMSLANKLLNRCNEVWNMYGPTETTICAVVKKVSKDDEIITIGNPIDNVQVYILDEHLNRVIPGTEGEIYISGAGVAKGYINRAELTAEKFIDDKFSTVKGQKMFKTGDLGKIYKNGEIQFVGRIDTQIKFRGYRIETEEIEQQLKVQKDIKDVLVIVRGGETEDPRLVAYFTLKKPVTTTIHINKKINEWRNELKKVLPEHMVPSDYVVIPNIPLLPSGKVNRKALPDPASKRDISGYVAPSTDLEKIITEIWENIFGIRNIGINDNFFDLGGTSLIAVRTEVEIEKVTNKRLSPSILFKYPTVKQLALVVNDSLLEYYQALVPIKPEGSKIPVYIVHGINLNVLNFRNMALNLDPDQPVYGFKAVNLDEQNEPLDTIEEIAAFYNNEMISNNPGGPFAIAGYSFGGVVAYEMVRQLKELGKEVKLLVMFDSAIQIPTHQYPLIKKYLIKVIRQFHKLTFRITSIVKQPKENIEYLKAIYNKKITKIFYSKDDTYGLPDYMQLTIAKLKEAFRKYKIVPQDVKINIFAGEKLYYLDDPKFLGWEKYALKGVTVHKVSGSHDDMFDPPYDKEIAAALQKLLNEINN